ncbi:plasmid mobilization protein [Mycetocola saprophilus]|uniref:plasmid mobilization protein n=1 Tax=Mycetocola saprophilus TaxID=76636 RepID=UPI003BF3BCEA
MTDETPKDRVFSRRRRANVEGGRLHRHEVKVSPEEEGALLLRANAKGITIPRLLVEAALADSTGETATDRRASLAELFTVHRTLGALGNNLNQIAKATNAARELPPELQLPLRHLLAALREQTGKLHYIIDELSES